VLGGLLGVVEGHLAENMMANVRVAYMMERMIKDKTEAPVHSADSTSQKIPFILAKVRDE
jgi:hypothetical protein